MQMNGVRVVAKGEYVYPSKVGLAQREGVERANFLKLPLLSNKKHDQVLLLSDTWKYFQDCYPAWTGTLVAYNPPEEKFGRFVFYKDLDKEIGEGLTFVLEVPAKAVGAKNCVLAVNHAFDEAGKPLIIYEERGIGTVLVRVMDQNRVRIIQEFPEKEGRYLAEPDFGIPVGTPVDYKDYPFDSRYLERLEPQHGNYIGLAGRNQTDYGDPGVGTDVMLCIGPSCRRGVLVESIR